MKYGNEYVGWTTLPGAASQFSPTAAYDPVTGYTYFAWLGGHNTINIINPATGVHVISNDWSYNPPTIAVFQGEVYVAWRGGGNWVNVAKLAVF